MEENKSVSYSEISNWKRCWLRHKYRYIDGLKLKEKPRLPRLGTMGHEGLRAFWEGKDWEKAIRRAWREGLGSFPAGMLETEEEQENLELVIRVVERYINQFDYFRTHNEYDLIEPETEFEVDIPGTDFQFIGIKDRVIKVPGEGIWLVEHKFTTRDLESFFDDLELDEQIDYYSWAISKLFPDEKMMGCIYNAIRLKLPTKPKPIKSGKRLSKRKMITDYETYMEAIRENGFDPADYAEQLEKLKNQPNPFFQTEWIKRSQAELKTIEEELIHTAQEIDRVYRGETFPIRNMSSGRCSWDCSYEDLCLCEKRGGNSERIIEEYYEYREDRKEKDEEDEDDLGW